MEWIHVNKGLRLKPDCLEICSDLLACKLISSKQEKSEESPLFDLDEKYRFVIRRKRILEAKVRSLVLTAPTSPSDKDIMSFPIQTFARQLTCFEFVLFRKVELREIVFWLKGLKEEREVKAANLNTLTNFVNRVPIWVATEIVTCPNLKRRQSLIKRYISIAAECFETKNYGGVLEIVTGLKHAAVQRMHQTWKIPQKYLAIFQNMAAVVSMENNWEHWRKLVKETTSPAYVPYIGLFLSDLTFVKDGGGDTLEIDQTRANIIDKIDPDGEDIPSHITHIGWAKYKRITGLLAQIEILQSQELEENIVPDLFYQQYFTNEMYILPENEIFKKSRELEPSAKRIQDFN